MVGWPMPRLTNEPARDVAGDERGHLVAAERPRSVCSTVACLGRGTPVTSASLLADALDRHHPVDVDARGHHVLGVQRRRSRRPRATWTIVVVAAVAITGPKLRAVLR